MIGSKKFVPKALKIDVIKKMIKPQATINGLISDNRLLLYANKNIQIMIISELIEINGYIIIIIS
ncbi:MAG: hypothetical protein GF311_07370 [Candidatus Lokiarchaeota archaeon]|nr:hypothetical protein [Candidatus Lokiarchaeota archaeon]